MLYEIDYIVQNYGVWKTESHKEKTITADEAAKIVAALKEMGAKESRSEYYRCTYYKMVSDCDHYTLVSIHD